MLNLRDSSDGDETDETSDDFDFEVSYVICCCCCCSIQKESRLKIWALVALLELQGGHGVCCCCSIQKESVLKMSAFVQFYLSYGETEQKRLFGLKS